MRCLSEKIPEPLELPKAATEWKPLDNGENNRDGRYTFELLTPMFGGGYKAGHINDQDGFEVRAATVRGHLREWWRRLYGNDKNKEETLLERETAIWGSVGLKKTKASNVKVQVHIKSESKVEDKNWKDERDKINEPDYSAYALFAFPLLEDDKGHKDPPKYCLKSMEFIVTITYKKLDEEQKEQVRNSLRAWANFGGIGARTRRGVGAIWCSTLACKTVADLDKIVKQIPGARLLIKTAFKSDPLLVWRRLVKTMSEFRSQKESENVSAWPEAHSVLGHTSGNKKPTGVPRSVFGLPLLMHDVQADVTKTLLPRIARSEKTLNRMASPIILRPVRISDGMYQAALFLQQEDLSNIEVVTDDKAVSFAADQIIDAKFSSYNGSPMKNLNSEGNAVDAYYKKLCNIGFKPGDQK